MLKLSIERWLKVCEILWVKRLLSELGRPVELPMKLFCDNKAAISIANNPVQHDRTKHVEIDRHFIKEKLEGGVVCVPFLPSSQQIADVFTKGLLRQNFEYFVSKLGMVNIPTCRGVSVNKKADLGVFIF